VTTTSARVPPGAAAPDFSLPASDGSLVSLADYRGKSRVLLVFLRGFR
jgi:peroxiredoxin